MAARTDQTGDDPVLGLIAKRKAEALARAEKEHNQLAAAAKTWAQGTKLVTDAEENLRRGREKQDTAIATMMDVGMDTASVAETLGIPPKAVTEALKRHRAAADPDAAAAPKPAKRAAKKAAPAAAGEADAPAEQQPAPAPAEPVADAEPPAPADERASEDSAESEETEESDAA